MPLERAATACCASPVPELPLASVGRGELACGEGGALRVADDGGTRPLGLGGGFDRAAQLLGGLGGVVAVGDGERDVPVRGLAGPQLRQAAYHVGESGRRAGLAPVDVRVGGGGEVV